MNLIYGQGGPSHFLRPLYLINSYNIQYLRLEHKSNHSKTTSYLSHTSFMMVSPALPISLCLLASYSHASDAASLLAFHPAAFAITIRSRPSTSTYLQTSTSPTSLPFYTASTRSAVYNYNNKLQYQHARARQPSKLHGKKDKYGIEKKSQQEILFELESKLDYEGRISSKVTSSSSEEDDDEVHNDDVDVDEGVVATATAATGNPHRCGLITILGEPNMGKSTLLNALLSDDLAM